jgi:hypothetical protein
LKKNGCDIFIDITVLGVGVVRRLLILIVLLFVPCCIFAQFSLGTRLGMMPFNSGNKDHLNIGNSYKTNARLGSFFKMGVIFKYRFPENFALYSEINLGDIKGFGYGDEWQSFELNYLEMPLLFQICGKTKFRWFAETGISLKYLLVARHNLSKYSPDGNYDYYEPENYFNRFMVTANIGAGLMFDVGKFTFFAGARVGYDINPIGKNIYDVNNVNWTFNKVRFFHIEPLFLGIVYNF